MTVLLAFQLALGGSGIVCAMPNGQSTASMTMSMGRSAGAVDQPAAIARQMGMPQQMPCNQQMHLAMCQAMGPCITPLAAGPVDGRTVRRGITSRVAALFVVAPPSRPFSPEPPPPRA